MSGLPQYNFPAFDAAAATLRKANREVVSPAELDSPEFRAKVLNAKGNEPDLNASWGDCLARDVKLIADEGIEQIVLLPGWQQSRGARLEAFVGLLCGLRFGLYEGTPFPARIQPPFVLMHIITGFVTKEWAI
jgi:hypothetical protein